MKKVIVLIVILLMIVLACGDTNDITNGLDLSIDSACLALPEDFDDIAHLSNWIEDKQYVDASKTSFGAVRMTVDPGHYVDGVAYYRVVPYHANLGLVGLLHTDHPNRFQIVRNWIVWYLDHAKQTENFIVLDHWYKSNGDGETTCPAGVSENFCNYTDAADSAAATFLGLVREYYLEGGDLTLLKADESTFHNIAAVMLNLQDSDGLTWANTSKTVKYLMDNSEVYWGFASMVDLAVNVFDNLIGGTYQNAADAIKAGIVADLYDESQNIFHIAKFNTGVISPADLNEWYPGTVALAWPQLFGVISTDSEMAKSQMSYINTNWDGDPNPSWSTNIVDASGFTWPSIGYATQLMNDCKKARNLINLIKSENFPDLSNRFTVSDTGWLLRTLNGFSEN